MSIPLSKTIDSESIEMILDVSRGFKATLTDLARKTCDTEDGILVKSLALMAMAVEARRQGKKVVFTSGSSSIEITGIRTDS